MISNAEISRKYISKDYPAVDFSSVRWMDVEGSTLTSYTANAPAVENVNETGIPGVRFFTAGDTIRHWMPLPRDIDYGLDVFFRVHFSTGSSTTSDGVAWKLWYSTIAKDTGSVAAGTSALTTVIASDLVTGAWRAQTSPVGRLAGGTIDPTTVDFLSLELELDATDVDLSINADEGVYAISVEVAYVPMLCGDTGGRIEVAEPW